MEDEYSIFDLMRLANKISLDINDWLTIREIAEYKKITVDELLKQLGRPEKDDLQTIDGRN